PLTDYRMSRRLFVLVYSLFFFCASGPHRLLLSFPTRRSSDLDLAFRCYYPPPHGEGHAEQTARQVPEAQEETANLMSGNLGSDEDRKSTRLNSSHVKISYAVCCLKKKKTNQKTPSIHTRSVSR